LLTKRPQTLSDQSDRYWSDINQGYEKFDSLERLVAALDELTMDEFKGTFQREILGPEHRRLVVASWGEKALAVAETKDWEERLRVIEPAVFKRDHGYHDTVHGMH